jgi:hypothetical protein
MIGDGDGDCEEFGGMKIGKGNRSTRRKPAPSPLCPIKMIEENVSGSEYVNFPSNKFSSCCTFSRGTIFIRGTEIVQCKVSDIPSRNSETNNFENGRAEFETKVDLSKKDCIE